MSQKDFSILRVILGSHLWLGICGAVCTWGTFVLLRQPVSYLYLGFVLAGTMTIYSFHGYFSLKERFNRIGETGYVPGYLLMTLATGSVGTAVLYFLLPRSVQFILLFPAIMAILYVFPLYQGKRLKDFPYIKIVAIVLAWTTVTYWVPVYKISHWWEEPGYSYLLLDRLLFFFAMAIPFDIRDMNYDRTHALYTIPNTIGVQNSQFLALFSLFMAAGFMTMGSNAAGIDSEIRIGLLAVYILAGSLIIRLKHLPSAGFYSWYMDGILFVYGFVVLFLSG